MKISFEALREVRDSLARYEAEVDTTDCTESTKRTCTFHTQHFVRWLGDNFEPGSGEAAVLKNSRPLMLR